MWLELPNLWIALINALGIPAVHLAIAWWSTQLPAQMFDSSPCPQNSSKIYERLFLIRRWKHLLPDGSSWMKGFAKGTLKSTDHDYLKAYISETRRGEFSHWVQWLAISLFIIWTPPPYHFLILFYATLANLPCILNLRYTRIRLSRVLSKSHHH